MSHGMPIHVGRHAAAILATWAAVCVALVGPLRELPERLAAQPMVPGEAHALAGMLADRFDTVFADPAVLVIAGVPGPRTEPGERLLREVTGWLSSRRGVQGVLSHLELPDPLFAPEGGGTFVLVALATGHGAADGSIDELRQDRGRLEERLRETHPGATLRFTGTEALASDLRQASSRQVVRSELLALPLTLGLLLVAFRTARAAALPLVTGVAAIVVALGTLGIAARYASLSLLTQNLVSMLGLGLGIDYALLTVTRFRELVADGLDAREAAREAAARVAPTLVASGVALSTGFVGLLATPIDELRSLGLAGAVVVTACVLASTTLLPALLTLTGDSIARRVKPAGPAAGWRRAAEVVARRPAPFILLGAVPLLALTAPVLSWSPRLPSDHGLPADLESVAALEDLTAMGRRGVAQVVTVLLEMPPETFALDERGWATTRRLGHRLAADDRVERVLSLPELAGPDVDHLQAGLAGTEQKRPFVSWEGDAALLWVVPRPAAPMHEIGELVRELRGKAEAFTGLEGTRLRVGGLAARQVDYADALAGRFPGVAAVVLGAAFVVLLLRFRSVLIALKAVLLNLLSVGAALGAGVLVFQEGWAAGLVGLDGPLGGTYPAVPYLVFCVVFGLSMDYEVFLVARVAEERRRGLDDAGALVEGMARTGSVISFAAAIMAVVFGAFATADVIVVKTLGFTLAVAVVADATLVRLTISPALIPLLSSWNWWPGRMPQPGSTP